VMAIIK